MATINGRAARTVILSSYTQTYATADKTHAAPTAANVIVDNSAGTSGGDTIAAVAAASVDTSAAGLATTRNAIATLAERVNELRADHLDLAQIVNSVIDDLE